MNKMSDIDAVLQIAKRAVFLSTIAFEHLDHFEKLVEWKKPRNVQPVQTVRRRFRAALNECARQGHCKKRFIGTTAYETADTLGGRSCIMYEFDDWVAKNGRS